jgi:tripartite-type tricarboxylate transporter receptor subunit TctC
MIQKIHGIDFNFIQFDGEAGGITAMMGNHIDAMVVGLMSASSYILSDSIRGLAVLSDKRIDSIKDVPAITEFYPEYNAYLPWGGAYYGVFVKEGTPQEIVDKLREAYLKAFNDPKFVELINNLGGVLLGFTGNEAREYVDHHRAVSSWLLYDAGGAKSSPDDFNIPRPSR